MNELMSLLGKAAPWLAAASAGPAGLAGMAIKTVAEALGAQRPEIGEVVEALAGATPEQMAALRAAEFEFKVRMQELGIKELTDLEAIAASDRKDARGMQLVTRSRMPAVLSAIITLGFLGLLTGMMTGALKADDNQAMLIMLGALGVAFGQVTNYWLGSTSESGRKTEMLAKAGPVTGGA